MGLTVNQVRKLRWFESALAHRPLPKKPARPSLWAHIAQLVEHILGKNEVPGSSPGVGSQNRIKTGGSFEPLLALCRQG